MQGAPIVECIHNTDDPTITMQPARIAKLHTELSNYAGCSKWRFTNKQLSRPLWGCPYQSQVAACVVAAAPLDEEEPNYQTPVDCGSGARPSRPSAKTPGKIR
eukprot:1368323-Amphidinium_carterae.1